MSLRGGDLTTPQRVAVWMAAAPTIPSAVITQLIGSMSGLIREKLNRARLYSHVVTRTFDGVGNMQMVLPDYPVTSIVSVQLGNNLVPASPLGAPNELQPVGTNVGYGYRFIPWNGELPGDPCVLDFSGGYFNMGPQNVRISYVAGYLISNEVAIVPAVTGPYTVTVLQESGVWCRDNGVTYADGIAMTPVASAPMVGQYIPPTDALPGVYTFAAADTLESVLISYSFVPATLEEATIQMIAERYSYRGRVGEIMKSLGGQETMRFFRGNTGMPWGRTSSLPPEVMDLIMPYISVLPPAIGSPV